ncbi:MAG: hypothetical protein ACRD8U_06215 [Pyrinomonadaceae bacterium]
MSWLVHKISRAKWEPTIGPNKISADAVTGDLRTKNNELSLWKIASLERAELEKVGTALAASLQRERFDPIDVTWIAIKELRRRKIRLQDSPGLTAAVAYKNLHVDAKELDLSALRAIAKVMARDIRQNDHFKRFTRAEVKQLLESGLAEGAVDRDLLNPKLRAELGFS